MAILDPGVRRLAEPALAAYHTEPLASLVDDHAVAMASVRRHALRRLLFADSVGLVIAAFVGPLIVGVISTNPASAAGRSQDVYAFNLAMIPVFICVFAVYGLYRGITRRITISVFSDLRNIVHALMISGFLSAVAAYGLKKAYDLESLTVGKIVALCVVAAVAVPLARAISFGLRGRMRIGVVPVIVVGTGKLAQTVATHLKAQPSVEFVGFVDDNPLGAERGPRRARGPARPLPPVRGGPGGGLLLPNPPRAHHRDAEGPGRPGRGVHRPPLLRADHRPVARGGPLRPAHAGHRPGRHELGRPLPQAVLRHRRLDRRPASSCHRSWWPSPSPSRPRARGRSSSASNAPGATSSPSTCSSSGPCTRTPRRADTSSSHLNEMDGPLFKVQNDPRVTRVGRFLRRTSLDELPQLINVWKGDMSLVGPRPFVVSEASRIEGWARKRFEARPGMTGLWQVSGRNELSHLELCRLDYLYVASWSFWWDMQILWQTPTTIFRGRGAS